MIKIVALTENTTCSKEYEKRHGLCLYVKTQKHRILFDVGPDGAFVGNAEKLGIDLKEVDTLVISHGHKDHAGGLKAFLDVNENAKIYLRKSATTPHYIKVLGIPFSVGMDKDLVCGERFVFTDKVTVIDDELTVFSKVSANSALPKSDAKLFAGIGGKLEPDDFSHEQNLLITSCGKTVLLSGCSHAGIVNIVSRAKETIGKYPDVAIGGFHLYNPPTKKYESDEYIKSVANALGNVGTKFYTCHCTGEKAYEKMKSVLGEKLSYLRTGEEAEVV